jgi:MoaA/NifB/PqqE/SkfB family radical SAM enzyme
MGLHEWVRVLEGLRSLGTLSVSLTGGDPLAHPDFLAIARAARERGLVVKVLTNGSLVTREMAHELAEMRVQDVELSIHGAKAGTHDEVTARPGSFEQLWRTVEILLDAGIRVVLKTPLTKLNTTEWEAMAALADEKGIPYVVDPLLMPRDDGDLEPLSFAAPVEAVESLFARLADRGLLHPLRRRVPGERNCGVGWSGVAVDPEGNVYPCLQWRKGSLGNVRLTPVAELWRAAPEREAAVSVSRRANDMLATMDGPVSGRWFCPARAHLVTGDPLGLDDGFLREATAAARVWHARAQETA